MLERGGNGGGGDRACSLAEERVAIPLEIHAGLTKEQPHNGSNFNCGWYGTSQCRDKVGAPDEAREVGQLLKSACGVVRSMSHFMHF